MKKIILLILPILFCFILCSCEDSKEPVRKPDYPYGYDGGVNKQYFFNRIFYEYEDNILKDDVIKVGFARRLDYKVSYYKYQGEKVPIINNIQISLQVDSFKNNPPSAIKTYKVTSSEFVSDEYAVEGYFPTLEDFKKTYDFSIKELIDDAGVEVKEGLCIMINYDLHESYDIMPINQVNLYGKTIDGKFILESIYETVHLPNLMFRY